MRPALALLALLVLTPAASAQDAQDPVEVQVGLLVINFGNYDANRGTYLLDFYLFFKWDPAQAPPGFTPANFEFMNGRASAKERIVDQTAPDGQHRELWYRIQANLYSEPRFEHFPFDTQTVQILFEDANETTDRLVYVPLHEESGLDEGFRAPGWRVHDPVFAVADKAYKFDETYSRASFSVDLSRERFSTTIKSFLPPLAFVLIASLQFFIHPTKWGNRIGLGTGMLISSVMFHVSQTVSLPPMPQLILFDKVMIGVYLFVLGSLATTALIAIDEDFWKTRDHTKEINAYGALASVALATLAVLLLVVLA